MRGCGSTVYSMRYCVLCSYRQKSMQVDKDNYLAWYNLFDYPYGITIIMAWAYACRNRTSFPGWLPKHAQSVLCA